MITRLPDFAVAAMTSSARRRFAAALEMCDAAQEAFQSEPTDLGRELVADAEDRLDDAGAVLSEWVV